LGIHSIKMLKGEVRHRSLPDTPKKKAHKLQGKILFERGNNQIERKIRGTIQRPGKIKRASCFHGE
jgi:hypothetical protein